jgi:hypothetical protein
MLLEKCKVLGMLPGDVENISDVEDTFLGYAINKSRTEEVSGLGKH